MKHLDSIRHRTSAVATKTDSDLITSIELSRGSTCHLFPLHLDEWTDDQEGPTTDWMDTIAAAGSRAINSRSEREGTLFLLSPSFSL